MTIKQRMTKTASIALTLLAVVATPIAANAEEPVWPKYKQAIACSGYYTVLHFYANKENPSGVQTAKFKGYASDWLKFAALLRQPGDDLEKDFDTKQQDANNLIMDDSKASELKQVQSYCMTNGIARFKWDQK